MGAPSEIDALVAELGRAGGRRAGRAQPSADRSRRRSRACSRTAPAWAGQLRYLDQVLVERIAEELPAVTVREVRVSVAREPGARA